MTTAVEKLAPHLDVAARTRLDELAAEVTANPARISVIFPAVARLVARGPADPADLDGFRVPRLEDQARGLLLVAATRALRGQPEQAVAEVTALYRFGDADEKRAVLRALADLDVADGALPLVADALRSNDVRLVAAALGPYAARHLDDRSWRQGVLKCLFVGVPLEVIAGLPERADAELARMVADYARERIAAGRPVPPDAALVLDRFPRQAED
ncbi:MAG: EboA domain-containing protein [Haloechinothrix sp.]